MGLLGKLVHKSAVDLSTSGGGHGGEGAVDAPFDGICPEVPKLVFFRVGPEIVGFGGSKRHPASPKPAGKGGGLHPRPHFPMCFWDAGAA